MTNMDELDKLAGFEPLASLVWKYFAFLVSYIERIRTVKKDVCKLL